MTEAEGKHAKQQDQIEQMIARELNARNRSRSELNPAMRVPKQGSVGTPRVPGKNRSVRPK